MNDSIKKNNKPDQEDLPGMGDLGSLSMDWDFKPDSPLGLRSFPRIPRKDLEGFFSQKFIPTKIAGKNYDETGQMIDLSPTGTAVFLKGQLQIGSPVKLGFILNKRKIISKGIIRNALPLAGGFRHGIEFIDLPVEHREYIKRLLASRIYRDQA